MGHVQDPTHQSGVRATNGNESDARAPRERKQDAALVMRMDTKEDTMAALRLGGYGWDEIARVLGYPSPKAALVAYEKALQRNLSQDEASVAKMRDLAGRRYERLLRAVWTKALDPDHPEQMQAQDRVRAILTDQARLFGLNAPAEMVVHTPTQSELQAFVANAISAANAGLDEDDIFDAEVVDGEEEQSA